jgi:hypothetical protein
MKRVSHLGLKGRVRLLGIAVVFTVAVLVSLLVVILRAEADVPAGETLVGTLDQSINSKDAQVGQRFTLSDVHSTNLDITGATIYGHVSHVQRAGSGTKADIGLSYDRLVTRAGNTYRLEARTTNVKVETKSNAGKETAATVGGAIVGGLLGSGVGAVLGAGTGFLVSSNSKQNVTIPQHALVSLEVVQARRQAQ